MTSRTIIYPGTFDPITKGHADIARRATRLFDRVIVVVAVSMHKKSSFSIEERVALAKAVFADEARISVDHFQGKLLIDYLHEVGAAAILRGIRAVSDFEVEFQMAAMNRTLAGDIDTIFMSPAEEYAYISSTLVREIAYVGGNTAPFVEPVVSEALRQKFAAATQSH